MAIRNKQFRLIRLRFLSRTHTIIYDETAPATDVFSQDDSLRKIDPAAGEQHIIFRHIVEPS